MSFLKILPTEIIKPRKFLWYISRILYSSTYWESVFRYAVFVIKEKVEISYCAARYV